MQLRELELVRFASLNDITTFLQFAKDEQIIITDCWDDNARKVNQTQASMVNEAKSHVASFAIFIL